MIFTFMNFAICISSALVLNAITVRVVFDENYSVLGKSKTR